MPGFDLLVHFSAALRTPICPLSVMSVPAREAPGHREGSWSTLSRCSDWSQPVFLALPGLQCTAALRGADSQLGMEPSGRILSIFAYCILWNPGRVDGDGRQGIFFPHTILTSGQTPDFSWFKLELTLETNFKAVFQRVTSPFFFFLLREMALCRAR